MVDITPEMQAQLDAQKEQCPFCKIIKGEIEGKKVYGDDLIEGILDINPWIKGHTLIVPKEHYPIMPFLPPETFKHIFGLAPKLVKAVKESMLCTGANIFIANGFAAGQKTQHFLIHIFPRENGDTLFDKFLLNEKKEIEEDKAKQVNDMLAKNLPMMMQNHFQRNPVSWHTGKTNTAEHLSDIKTQKIYEDEKVLCIVPENPQSLGHLVIYSNEEKTLFENLDEESASHMFFTASFCATAVFEGLGAQGSNIILKTGKSDDNPDGRLCIHILPRNPEDGLDILPEQMKEVPNLDDIQTKIKDKMFMVEYEQKEEKEPEKIVNLDSKPELISDIQEIVKEKEFEKPEDEIKHAINKIRKNN